MTAARPRACRFLPVEPDFLRKIASGSDVTPSLYYHPNPILRRAFWGRLRAIHRQMAALGAAGGRVLDFGGGGGVFLPTLAARFDQAVCVDRDAREARQVAAHYDLANVVIDETNILTADYGPAAFDVVVAADVLEHFPELAPPVDQILRWLKPGGLLFTSLPTESGLYALARRVFGVAPPPDHYHDAAGVEAHLAGRGLIVERRGFHPLPWLRYTAMFSIVAWRRP